MKAAPIRQPTVAASRAATSASTGRRTRYWRRRNAIAPVSMSPAMKVARSPPAGFRLRDQYTYEGRY
jgi:hypothetical protein